MSPYEALLTLLLYFTQLLAIMNPFSVIPTFLGMTEGMSGEDVSRVIRRASLAGLLIVITFTLAGSYILKVFNVSIAGLRVGGGVVLMVLAIDMLGGQPRTKRVRREDIAVVPIATPLLIGPGTITTILLLTSSKPGDTLNLVLVLVAGIAACATSFAILRLSRLIVKYLRISVVRALGRFMALIIAGVAAEMMVSGISMYYHTFFK
jgi:multiple antibiotic resistance protein